jgi:pimeloyl-ACP methyl ester carboxylesterase
VVLVGISSAGMVITGVAERAPERIGHLIYLDAFVPQDGQSFVDVVGPEVADGVAQAAQTYGDGWRIPHNPPDADRRTDALVNVLRQPLAVGNPAAARLKRTFVLFTDKPPQDWLTAVLAQIAARIRQEAGWSYDERPFGHWPVLDRPHELAELLLELG